MKIGGNAEKAIDLIDNAIALRKHRGSNLFTVKNNDLTNEENMVLNKIKENLRQTNLLSDKKSSQFNFDDKWNTLIDKHGKKDIVDYFIEPTMICGVPYIGFLINALICLIVFIVPNNNLALLVLAPVIHLICFLENKINHEKRRKEKIQKIISGEFKLFS